MTKDMNTATETHLDTVVKVTTDKLSMLPNTLFLKEESRLFF